MQLVELLITTYGKNRDEILSILRGINLKSDCIIRNQTSFNKEELVTIGQYKARIIYADDKGLSKNRNELLKLAKAEYLLFVDDDSCFIENYANEARKMKESNIDGIIFNTLSLNPKRTIKRIRQNKKCKSFYEISSFGIWGLIIKRDFLLKNKLFFNEKIGSGTNMPCGEDSVFLKDLINCKCTLLLNTKILLSISQESSLWYSESLSEQILFAKGAVYKRIYGHFWRVVAMRFLCINKRRIAIKKPFNIMIKGSKTNL